MIIQAAAQALFRPSPVSPRHRRLDRAARCAACLLHRGDEVYAEDSDSVDSRFGGRPRYLVLQLGSTRILSRVKREWGP